MTAELVQLEKRLSGRPTLLPWLGRNSLGIAIGLVAIVGAMVFVFFEPLVVNGHHVWLLSGTSDIWYQWRAAGLLPNAGGYSQIFSFDRLLKTPPGWELLISPVAHRFLSLPFPFAQAIPHPRALWIAGPTELAAVPFCMCAVDVWMRRLGSSLGRRVATLATLAVVLPPASLWGHPEDLMALGCALLALRAVRDGRWSAGWWMGAALAFQVEAVLVLPLCVVLLERRRIAFLLESTLVPLAVLAVPLIGDTHDTVHALLHQTIFPGGIRYTPLKGLNVNSATLDDVLTLLVASVVAVWVWRHRDRVSDASVFWLVGALYSLRLLYPSLYPYYLVPAMAVFCAASAITRVPRLAATLVLGGATTWWLHFAPVDGQWLNWISDCYLILMMALLSYPPRWARQPSQPALPSQPAETAPYGDMLLDPPVVATT